MAKRPAFFIRHGKVVQDLFSLSQRTYRLRYLDLERSCYHGS